MKKEAAEAEIREELDSASELCKPFNSPHEGYAVLLEEVEELWDEIKAYKDNNPVLMAETKKRMRAEAKQVAAMAWRLMIDCT